MPVVENMLCMGHANFTGMAILSNKQRYEEIYRVAHACEQAKAMGCKGGTKCTGCPYDLSECAEFYKEDQIDVALIRASARTSVHKYGTSRGELWLYTILFIGFILLWAWSCSGCSFMSELLLGYDMFYEYPEPPTQYIASSNLVETKKISQTISKQVRDVNGDGLVNCIDYAILFCLEYPGSRIIHNHNVNTKMNHLFNAIQVNGRWVYIEPQGGLPMETVWGREYVPYYNVDATTKYLLQAKINEPRIGARLIGDTVHGR